MRVNKMKNVLRKVGAFALAFMMAVQPAGGMDAGMKETKAADISQNIKKVSENTRFNMEVEKDSSGTLSLEKGDEFTVKIIRKTQVTNVVSISGWLRFYVKNRQGEYVSANDCFDEIRLNDYQSLRSDTEVTIDNALPRKITLSFKGDKGVSISDNSDLISIKVRVKRAVDNLKIEFGGPAEDSDIQMQRYISTSGKVEPAGNQAKAVAEVTNKWAALRKLSFTVAGNSGSGNNIQVPIKNTKTSRSKIAIKVNKDNGTEKNIGYSAFSLKFTYDPEYLALYEGNSYELSDAANKVKNKLHISTETGRVEGEETRWYKISFVENQPDDKGIGVYGDFLYLSFVPVTGKSWADLQGANTTVKITIMGGVDQFAREMNPEVNGDTSYHDGTLGEDGGNVDFDVSFVKSLYKFGDVNNDTYVNLIDAVMILKYYNGDMSLTEDQLARANVNDDYWNQDSTDSSGVHKKGDPLVTLVDAVLIVECYNGTRSEDDLPYTRTN